MVGAVRYGGTWDACCSKCGISGGQCELPDYVNSASRGLRYAHAVRRSCVAANNIVQPHFSASAASREEERDASVHHFLPDFCLQYGGLSFSCSRIGSFLLGSYIDTTPIRVPYYHVLARQGPLPSSSVTARSVLSSKRREGSIQAKGIRRDVLVGEDARPVRTVKQPLRTRIRFLHSSRRSCFLAVTTGLHSSDYSTFMPTLGDSAVRAIKRRAKPRCGFPCLV